MATTAISKRQQARNERTLQDLIRTVPGNDRCADCSAKSPGWASWSLGIFLCMRCAALHRKLGTHVSKVKSLSMDTWSADQVENMKNMGNVASNKRYNPGNGKAQLPVDVDDVEAAIEKYIRQKYEQRAFVEGARPAPTPAVRQNTGSTGTGSWNDEPPPLPPKPGKRFGFSLRSTSSTLSRQKQDRKFTPPMSPTFTGSDRSAELPSPRKASKPSQLFGMKITSTDNDFDAKLAALRDMGFSDNRRNSDILKSSNGSLDRAIESLVVLGEGSKPTSGSATPGLMTLKPLSTSSGVIGITVDKTRQAETKKANNNPWEIHEEVPQRAATQPLPQQLSGPAPAKSWNPFLNDTSEPQVQQQVQDANLASVFQNLQVSQAPVQQQQYVPQVSSMVPMHYHNAALQHQANPWNSLQMQPQQAAQVDHGQQYYQATPVQQPQQTINPFLRHTQSQTFASSNPWAQPASQSPVSVQNTSNPYGSPWQQQQQLQQQSMFQQAVTQSPAPIYGHQEGYFAQPQQAPFVAQAPYQPQQQPQQPPQQLMHSPTGMLSQQQMPPQQQMQQPQQQMQQPQQPQQYSQPIMPPPQPVRHDKSSILSLYNYPQLAPQWPLQSLPENGGAPALPSQAQYQQPYRSVTMPVQHVGNMSSYASQPPPTMQGGRHVSNESVDFQGMAGRHSPDAFSGLSARYMR